MRHSLALSFAAIAVACSPPPPIDYPREAVQILAKNMASFAILPPDAADAGYHVYDLGGLPIESYIVSDACHEPTYYLSSACRDVAAQGLAPAGCSGSVALLGAYALPSCAIRLNLPAPDPQDAPRVLAVDLNTCTSRLDCQSIPFSGCETIIQRNFQALGIATVNASTWTSPRTHVMHHDPVPALRPLDPALCSEAQTAATRVCDELLATMTFVEACQPYVRFRSAPRPACTVRFDIRFNRADPANSVVTTKLDGLLSFALE